MGWWVGSMNKTVLLVYLAGVIIGLSVMRDRWPTRLVTAALWPLGVLAFVTVFVIMLAAATYLWPIGVLTSAAVVAGAIWLLT
jgi:hypothetical protein